MLRQGIRQAAKVLVPRSLVNVLTRRARSLLGPTRFDALMGRGHRKEGYRLLDGRGIEIGALHAPAPLPTNCSVIYVDAIGTDEARRLFPEVDPNRLVSVDIIADLDRDGLSAISDATYDFAVMNHVIEHVANPIKVIEEVFRVVRSGGRVVISAPDMRFSFDRDRSITPDDHLVREYREGVTVVTDDHYEEFVRMTMPGLPGIAFAREVTLARQRREHAHVWDSLAFERFIQVAQAAAGVRAALLYEVRGHQNRLEYFSVWEKLMADDHKDWPKSDPPKFATS